ncbi:MAG: VOC family protein [Burkholderiales bacterium]|jgi:catechol 2,3-dioxygenase-like lactoylglutathione lyase family enzyme|nr:VOC family protein [Burkholderiales bacterium]
MDRLHHVAIAVPEIAPAVAWYRGQFQVEIVYQDATWALLRFANIDLALVVPDQHPPHMAIERPDATRFGTLKTHRDGTASVYVDDPFGNVIEIMQAGLPDGRSP